MKKYDLHVHTYHSNCSALKPKTILKKAKKKELDGIAITDHNTIKGALEVKRLNKDKDFEVIIGEEVKTDKGEVLAYYLKKEIKPGKFEDVIRQIRQQNALAVIPHPYDFGFIRRKLKVGIEDIKSKIDGIEALNGRCSFTFINLKAQIKAKELGLSMIAGSDAHFKFEIGKCYTEFEGTLRKALKKRKTKIYGSTKKAIIGRLISVIPQIIRLFHHLTLLILR